VALSGGDEPSGAHGVSMRTLPTNSIDTPGCEARAADGSGSIDSIPNRYVTWSLSSRDSTSPTDSVAASSAVAVRKILPERVWSSWPDGGRGSIPPPSHASTTESEPMDSLRCSTQVGPIVSVATTGSSEVRLTTTEVTGTRRLLPSPDQKRSRSPG